MDPLSSIKSKYAKYRLDKISRLETGLNVDASRVSAASTSPDKLQPDKLKITLGTLPRQLSIAKQLEQAVSSLGRNPSSPNDSADEKFIKEFEAYARSHGIAAIGYTEVPPEFIFKDRSALYSHAIVLTMEMDKAAVDSAPSAQAQAEGIVTYDVMGKKTAMIAEYLRDHGYSAEVSHPAGGYAMYPRLALKAGMGWGGRHGLLITPQFGPRQRISAIFTSIRDLPVTDNDHHAWIPEFCAKCGNCVRKCPGKAIYEKPIIYPDGRHTHIDKDKCVSCTICMKECSFNRKGYDTIRKAMR